MKTCLFTTALLAALTSGPAAAFSVGTYQFDNSAVASALLSGSGMAYNGTDYYWGSGPNWQIHAGSGWTAAGAPSELTDTDQLGATTFLAATPGGGGFGLELGFNALANGGGSDLAFFFLFDQTGNSADVTINGITRGLSLSDVFDGDGDQQVANGVSWNGQTLDNVRLMVGEADLADFGVATGAAWENGVQITLGPDSTSMALSMAAALNTGVTAIPVPAALPLMLGGLSLLGLAARRRG